MTDSDGQVRKARTNQFGYFRFTDVQAGETFVINTSAKGYTI